MADKIASVDIYKFSKYYTKKRLFFQNTSKRNLQKAKMCDYYSISSNLPMILARASLSFASGAIIL